MQCESQAKQQALYSRRDANWIEWPDAQKARMAAEKAYKDLSSNAAPAKKLQALKEWLIICLHTVQPPECVHGLERRPLASPDGEPALRAAASAW